LPVGAGFGPQAQGRIALRASVPQGVQSDASFAASGSAVAWAVPTDAQTSCYLPEVPYASTLESNGYSGESACPGATTGEDLGPYTSQAGSNSGFPASGPLLVKDHSESDIRVDPTNPSHLIGLVKWIVSAEGYNHLLGFYESFDGGSTWPVQGHIPGYEGWTDNTDPVGAFDPWGNYYEFILPYQFRYAADGSHDASLGTRTEPNPTLAAEVVSVAVRPHGGSAANPLPAASWITTHAGHPDLVASYDSIGNEPDKQWLTIDDNPASPHYGRVYAMWTVFHARVAVPYVAYADSNSDGTHTDWSPPMPLPLGAMHPTGDTDATPQVAADGTVYTALTGYPPRRGGCCYTIVVDYSTDGGVTWQGPVRAVSGMSAREPANTTFRSGFVGSFAIGPAGSDGHVPLYVAYLDGSAGTNNIVLTASYDNGSTWVPPIQVNDNVSPADEFQPNVAAAPDGSVSVAFYDRRLRCPTASSTAAVTAGLSEDTTNQAWSGPLPPYGAANYCIDAAIQFYDASLSPRGHNIRVSPNTWDPQLNAPHPYGIAVPITFVGDYFGNTADTALGVEVMSFVSTANDDGHNPQFRQQQVVARVTPP
jgi:hypothetical protein